MELQWVWLVVRWLHLAFLQEKKKTVTATMKETIFTVRCLTIAICLYELFVGFVAIAISKNKLTHWIMQLQRFDLFSGHGV